MRKNKELWNPDKNLIDANIELAKQNKECSDEIKQLLELNKELIKRNKHLEGNDFKNKYTIIVRTGKVRYERKLGDNFEEVKRFLSQVENGEKMIKIRTEVGCSVVYFNKESTYTIRTEKQ